MADTDQLRFVTEKIQREVRDFQRNETKIGSEDSLRRTLVSLQEKANATQAQTAEAYDVLKDIADALGKIQDLEIDQLLGQRQKLVDLRRQAEDKAAAIDVLIGPGVLKAYPDERFSTAVNKIQNHLVTEKIAQQGHWFLENKTGLKKYAEQLLRDRLALSALDKKLEQRIKDSSSDMNQLKQDFIAFKTEVTAKLAAKGDRASVARSVETRLSRAIEEGSALEGRTWEELFSAMPQPGLLAGSVAQKSVVNIKDLDQKTHVVELSGVSGEHAACAIKTVTSGTKVAGVYLAANAYRLDAEHQLKAVSKQGKGKLTDADRVLALEAGLALAQVQIELSKANSMSFFGAKEKLNITGQFFITKGMTRQEVREIYCNIISMACTIKALESSGCQIDKMSVGYKDYVAAKEQYVEHVGVKESEFPEFMKRFNAIGASTLEKSAVDAVEQDIKALGRDLGRSDLSRGLGRNRG